MDRDPIGDYGDSLAAVTVTSAGRPVLDGFRSALAAATRGPVLLVVADLPGAPETDLPDAQLVPLPEDVGWTGAVNRAVAGLEPEIGWIALADPRVRWRPGAVDALLAAGARRPRAGLLGPRLHGPDGTVVASGGAIPGVWAAARGRIPTGTPPAGPGWLCTAAVLVRRTAWDSVDGFDPRYPDGPGGMGDVDLGDRLGRAGWLVVAVAEAGVDAEPGVGDPDGHGILESHAAALRRYVHDRARAPVRALAALPRRR